MCLLLLFPKSLAHKLAHMMREKSPERVLNKKARLLSETGFEAGGALSVLALRHVEADAVQFVARDELTGKAGVLR